MPSQLPPCATYLRVSSSAGKDTESASYQTEDEQRERGEAFARARGLSNIAVICDRDRSGADWDRAGLNRVMDLARDGKIKAVIVYKVSRLGRGLRGVLKTVDELDELGVTLMSVTEPIDTSNAQGRLLLNVLASFDEYERELRGEYLDASKTRSFARGVHLGPTPYGYARHERERHLIIDPVTGPIVGELFAKRDEGTSLQKLVDWLESIDAPTPRAGRGTSWSTSQVGRILSSRVYIGEVRYRGETRPACHEPIVPTEVFGRVQGAFSDTGRVVRRFYVLRGAIRCGTCGAKMSGKFRKDGALYQCTGSSKEFGKCASPSYILAETIEAYVHGPVERHLRLKEASGASGDVQSLKAARVDAEAAVLQWVTDTALEARIGKAMWQNGLDARQGALNEMDGLLRAATSATDANVSADDVLADPILLNAAIKNALAIRVYPGRGLDRVQLDWRGVPVA